ncbi:MAG: cation:proton antiporter [Verrucomicrobia bacterium]|nr:MAG: cation:proton antiporter [Verrucomicrobiota bacterium]TAE87727.1 MAG: cation:proton antiporter [Verrucomicrobiota bacterium]TAF25340.1 MAG: cation:proton antiporter [Verrucomicrobiota bacterium]TAF41214.1 MAG: cation:proton antiporter [Verrucomicrobiota bacterium]
MHALSASFFLQMAVILVACRLVGMVARKLGQPQVVGEMIAGVLLGPSLLGQLWPGAAEWIFTKESRSILYVGAQLGVGLYMFLVGLEFRTDHFRSRARSAACVSIAGMLVPFLLGALLVPWLREVPGIFSPKLRHFEAALFLGAAIAITAFPMLARIISERGLSGTPLGTLALAAGAIDDAAAWCVLAVVLATFGASQPMVVGGFTIGAELVAIGGSLLYGIVALTIGKRLLAGLGRRAERDAGVSDAMLAVVLALFCLAAWYADIIGVHAVFGGFILGIAMPRGVFADDIRKKLEPFAVVFLLPMFFTFSGLNTQLDLLVDPRLLLVGGAILLASMLGKFVACWAAARLNGEDSATALAVGTLMNARGLMELIIINIGLQHGIIGEALFSILVMMAIVTTLMATPLFERVYGRKMPRGSSV